MKRRQPGLTRTDNSCPYTALCRSVVGRAAVRLRMHERYGLHLLAISRSGERLVKGLGDTILRPGDVVVLQGVLEFLPEHLRELGCLPLADRPLGLGSVRQRVLPVAILALPIARKSVV